MAKDLILDPSEYDTDSAIADIDEIRRHNRQRHEMEQLTAVVFVDPERKIVVGYKDLTENEFWVRGHMPGIPLMPGVLMCEAAAQLCSFFAHKYDLLGSDVIGFGALEARFRDPVFPGSRLVIVAQMTKVRRGAMIVSRFQALVDKSIVCEGVIKGVPLPAHMTAGLKPA